MSDLLTVRQKIVEGKEWTKRIEVAVDGDDYELTIRQLRDPEFLEVYNTIDVERLREIASDSDGNEEDFERLQELRQKDDLSDEEQAELEMLQESVSDEQGKLIEALGQDAFKALMNAGRAAVVPDDEDISELLSMSPSEQKEIVGKTPRTRQEAGELLEAEVEAMLTNSVDLVSFNAGVQAFFETLDAKGN